MGQRFTLSFSDIKMANLAYNCGGKGFKRDLKLKKNHKKQLF